MTAIAAPDARAAAARRAWLPRQHGAWAMLLLPVLLGVSASRPVAWQLVLLVAAVSGYLASAAWQSWSRSRRSVVYRAPLIVYGAACAGLAIPLVAAFPLLLVALVAVVPAGLVVIRGARPGTKRDLATSLAQVAQAVVLAPAAAWVSGAFEPRTVLLVTAVTAAYLVSTVLAVRSVIRERSNVEFAVASGLYHLVLVVLAAWALPAPYVVVAALLAARAIAAPILQRRMAGGSHPIRPIHLGMTEIVASLVIVGLAYTVPITAFTGA